MISLPKDKKTQTALGVVKRLQDAGYLAYFAGGSVRDLILGRAPKDYDIVTSAEPEETERLFHSIVPIGKQFGILLIREDEFAFEVATFRGERGFTDNRRPDEVFWTGAKEDALRRDFTINALFYDPVSSDLHDFVDGVRDIQAEIVRFVGDPDTRIQEDYLRILRAVRLKNTLGFQYDSTTYQALKRYAAKVTEMAPERILNELDRMWADKTRADSLVELSELGILEAVLPEVEHLHGVPQPKEYHQEGDVFDHTVAAVKSLPEDSPSFLVWSVICHDIGKAVTLHYPTSPDDRIRFDGHKDAGAQMVRQLAKRLHFSNEEKETIAWLVEHHMNLVGIDKMREAKRREYLFDPRFKWLLELHKADASGTTPRDLSLYNEVKSFYERYKAEWQQHQTQGKPKPLVTGIDLQNELGMEPSQLIGEVLRKLYEAQLENQITTREEGLNLAKKLINR